MKINLQKRDYGMRYLECRERIEMMPLQRAVEEIGRLRSQNDLHYN